VGILSPECNYGLSDLFTGSKLYVGSNLKKMSFYYVHVLLLIKVVDYYSSGSKRLTAQCEFCKTL